MQRLKLRPHTPPSTHLQHQQHMQQLSQQYGDEAERQGAKADTAARENLQLRRHVLKNIKAWLMLKGDVQARLSLIQVGGGE